MNIKYKLIIGIACISFGLVWPMEESITIDPLRCSYEVDENGYKYMSIIEGSLWPVYKKAIYDRSSDEQIGYINGILNDHTSPTPFIGFINQLYVRKNFRKKGFGTRLMHHLCADFKQLKVEEIRLRVKKNNQAAIDLYEKFGFKKDGERGITNNYLLMTRKQKD